MQNKKLSNPSLRPPQDFAEVLARGIQFLINLIYQAEKCFLNLYCKRMKTKLLPSPNKAILIFINILVTSSSQEFIKIKLAIIIISLKVHFSPARSINQTHHQKYFRL